MMSNTETFHALINGKARSFFNKNNTINEKIINRIETLKSEKEDLKFQKPKLDDIKNLINEFENNYYELTQKAIKQMNNLLKEGHKIKGGSPSVKIKDFLKSNDNRNYDYIERIKKEIKRRIDNESKALEEQDKNLLISNYDDLIGFTFSLNIKENEINTDITDSKRLLKLYINQFIIQNLKTSIFNLTKNESSNEIKKLEEQITSLERLQTLLNFGTVYFKINKDLYYSDGKERAKAGDILNYSLSDLISKVINNIGNKTDDEIKEYIRSIFSNNSNFLSIEMLAEIETEEGIEFIKEYKIDKDNKTIKLVDHINSFIEYTELSIIFNKFLKEYKSLDNKILKNPKKKLYLIYNAYILIKKQASEKINIDKANLINSLFLELSIQSPENYIRYIVEVCLDFAEEINDEQKAELINKLLNKKDFFTIKATNNEKEIENEINGKISFIQYILVKKINDILEKKINSGSLDLDAELEKFNQISNLEIFKELKDLSLKKNSIKIDINYAKFINEVFLKLFGTLLKLDPTYPKDYISSLIAADCLFLGDLLLSPNIIDEKFPLINKLLEKDNFFTIKATNNEEQIKNEIKGKVFFIKYILEKNIDQSFSIQSLDPELEKFNEIGNLGIFKKLEYQYQRKVLMNMDINKAQLINNLFLKLSNKSHEDYISDIAGVCVNFAKNITDEKLPLIKELLTKEKFFEVKETENKEQIQNEIEDKISFIQYILEKNIDQSFSIQSLDPELEKFNEIGNLGIFKKLEYLNQRDVLMNMDINKAQLINNLFLKLSDTLLKSSQYDISDIAEYCLEYVKNIADEKLPLINKLLEKDNFFTIKATNNEKEIQNEIEDKISFIKYILEKNIDIKSLDIEIKKFIKTINNTNINLSNVTTGSNEVIR